MTVTLPAHGLCCHPRQAKKNNISAPKFQRATGNHQKLRGRPGLVTTEASTCPPPPPFPCQFCLPEFHASQGGGPANAQGSVADFAFGGANSNRFHVWWVEGLRGPKTAKSRIKGKCTKQMCVLEACEPKSVNATNWSQNHGTQGER